MVSKAPDVTFGDDWNKLVAWAQSSGISMSVVQPVYSMDLGRLQSGSYPMSNAERIRAIQAAANPNQVTQVPETHSGFSLGSLLGNAVNDLRNIFTGLAPNHLIPNMWHMAETAIVHPSSWIAPIEDIGKGVFTGDFSEIRKGFDLASGPGSVLSLLPGVADVDELLHGKAGLEELWQHPISSFIDIAPFAPAGRVLGLAMDESRMADLATHLGMSVDDLYKASVPKLAAKWVLSRDVVRDVDGTWKPRFPGVGKLTRTLVDEKGQPLNVSGMLRMWGQTHTGVSRTAAHVAAAAFDLRSYGTEAEMFTVVPLQRAEAALTDDQRTELHALVDKTSEKAQGKTRFEVMADGSIDPQVRDAYEKYQDMLDMFQSEALASGALLPVRGPSYQDASGNWRQDVELYSVDGEPHEVVKAARAAKAALQDAMKAGKKPHRLTLEIRQLDERGDTLASSLEDLRHKAQSQVHDGTLVDGRASVPLRVSDKGKVRELVGLDRARQANLLVGDDGLLAQIGDAVSTSDRNGNPRMRDAEAVLALTDAAKRALSRDAYKSVDAAQSPTLLAIRQQVDLLHEYAKARIARENAFLRELKDMSPAKLPKALKKAVAAHRQFLAAWWGNPPDRWRGVLYDKMTQDILDRTATTNALSQLDGRLKSLGWTDDQIARVHRDPKVLAQRIWMEAKQAGSNPAGAALLSDDDIRSIYANAVDEVSKLRQEGHEVAYVPAVSSLDIRERDPGRYGVGIARGAHVDIPGFAKRRVMDDFMPERHDLLAAVHLATKDAIQRDITIEFVDKHLAPRAMTAGEVADWAMRAFRDEFSSLDPRIRNEPDLLADVVARRLGLTKWDPTAKVGFSFPRWQGKAIYLPANLADAVDKLLEKGQFPMEGTVDKVTKLFRFSVLGLSPRYTAHIVFGGTMLLALRSTAMLPRYLGDAWRMVRDGSMPREIVQRATEYGIEPIEYRTVALDAYHKASGAQLGNMVVQGELAKDGIDWRKASPIQWVKAAGNANFRFTNWVVKLQRSLAYLDYAGKAERRGDFINPETGLRVPMTADRARYEGIQHALKAMGDLKAMTPFERSVMTRVIPFWGWSRHILQYVATYPVDHPFRAQFLTILADQQSNSVAAAYDKRISFLFFLGSPDAQGNVSAVDVRFLDPLRDVANYATLGGWISALNPLIEAPLAMIDPQLIYGANSIYPNVSYDSFFGIEVAGSQGSPWNALEQVVPQATVLDAAFNLSGEYRALAQKNPSEFAKLVFENLNIPFAQVQRLNLRQLAVKGELARYKVAEQAAQNAWQSGDFSGLVGYSSVPNPLNTDYNITPAALQALYQQAQQQYPGLPPSETVPSPPSPANL